MGKATGRKSAFTLPGSDADHVAREIRRLDDRTRVLEFRKPRCPRCRSAKLTTLRSLKDCGDGTTWRRVACDGCLLRFDFTLV